MYTQYGIVLGFEKVPLTPDLLGHLIILIQTVIPHVNDDQLHEILQLRCKIEEDPLAGVADAEALESLFPPLDCKLLEER